MKTLGQSSTDGSYIVSMTRDEYGEFLKLENAVTSTGWFGDRREFQGADLSPVFRALSDLATAKYSITSLQDYINKLAEYFGKVSPITKE